MPDNSLIRNFENYGGKKLIAFDKKTLEEFTFGAIPMRLFKYQNKLTLTLEVWESIPDFNAGKPTSSKFSRTWILNYAEIITDFSQFFDLFISNLFAWLEVSPDDYEMETFDINLTNLKISAKANHKTNAGKAVEDVTANLNEFEQIKSDYPELVQMYFAFGWTYAQTHDVNLAKFQ